MATGNDLYDVSCPVQSINEESADDDADEVLYEDLLDSNDLVTAQLASAGPVGLAAAAAIASGKKRRRLHSFETNPSIRKRQQTRLLRKLCSLMEEYIVRVGQQAVIVCCSPNKSNQNGSFRVYGSQPLEGIVKGRKSNIMNDLEKLLTQQATQSEVDQSDLFELPSLSVEGMPTSLERMTQAQLRYFIPEVLKHATGKSKPGWGKPECRPAWWPDDVPWANVRSDVRDEESKKETPWTIALRKIVRSCYKYHNREDLLDPSQPPNRQSYDSQNVIGSVFLGDGGKSSVVVQQVTNPDGSIKIVQLDTSALSLANVGRSLATVTRQQSPLDAAFTKLPETLIIKEESQPLDIPDSQKKIIRLTRKRSCPPGLGHATMISFSNCLRLDGSNSLNAANTSMETKISHPTFYASMKPIGPSIKMETDINNTMGKRN